MAEPAVGSAPAASAALSPQEMLVGDWSYVIGDECVLLAAFDVDNEWSFQRVCSGDLSEFQIQRTAGRYTATDAWVYMWPTESSCSDTRIEGEQARYSFRLDGDELVLNYPEFAVILARNDSSSGDRLRLANKRLSLGCFGEDGVFRPGPVFGL